MKQNNCLIILLAAAAVLFHACSIPAIATQKPEVILPDKFAQTADDAPNAAAAQLNWHQFFADSTLTTLIDTALLNNQELDILLQHISVAQNEILSRKGEYRPFVTAGTGAEVEKVGEFTRNGAVEKNLPISDGKAFPEWLGNLQLGLFSSWELDVWHKLRNNQKIAFTEYLASIEGRNFMITKLVAEIANSYFELIALDNQLQNLENNIQIQQNALEVVRLLQQAGRVNMLAVRRFEAEVQKNKSRAYDFRQQITALENQVNFLAGRTPQSIPRQSNNFLDRNPDVVETGIPSQLLANRPDIRQAELEMAASDLNIKVAKANFLPSFGIKAGIGYQAFNPKFLLQTPESMVFSLAGDAMAPLVNRSAIIAEYKNANARQITAAYEYEQRVLNAYQEVATQLSNLDNLANKYQLKAQQVQSLTESIEISNQLFQSARADYMEVLLTQRDALEAREELIETKKAQMNAMVNLYRALGGGWQ
jgi:NodT family efflux transporter outer membrane factor (OMF) lipoprotein